MARCVVVLLSLSVFVFFVVPFYCFSGRFASFPWSVLLPSCSLSGPGGPSSSLSSGPLASVLAAFSPSGGTPLPAVVRASVPWYSGSAPYASASRYLVGCARWLGASGLAGLLSTSLSSGAFIENLLIENFIPMYCI